MTNKTNQIDRNTLSPKSRRTALQTMMIGGTAISAKLLPDAWTRPVIDSVVLPAHAQATGEEPTNGDQPTNGTAFSLECSIEQAFQSLSSFSLDIIITPVNNADGTDSQPVDVLINYVFLPSLESRSTTASPIMNQPNAFVRNAIGVPLNQTTVEVTVTFSDDGTFGSAECFESAAIDQD